MDADAHLRQGLTTLGIELAPTAERSLLQYLSLLTKWNRVYNLTAIREPSRVVSHHLLDSLSVLPHLSGVSLADVGAGAGLPGVPLAIARSDWRIALVESNHKKAAFLRQAVIELKLQNVQVIIDRVEHWGPPNGFDVVISRAFSDLPGFVEAAQHLCSSSGVLAAMKGVYPDEELAQLPPDWHLERVVPLEVPGVRAARHLVLLRRDHTA
ncbi:MAG TPA: 16S rRNA (guanine(527)-N(7))-methyltransferase RsmG [Burkholderiales bacterium]|nr:16S rRNA (guanine(527)-N(7))-methyltransferase RsmG [Burkholderiales bacterium]